MKRLPGGWLIVLAVLFFVSQAQASVITFNLDTEFSGGTEPQGPKPWLSATFTDTSTGVLLTMTNNLVGSEFVAGLGGSSTNPQYNFGWGFNFDPTKTLVPSTAFSHVSGVAAAVITGTDQYKANGDGYFDILFSFDRFTGTQTSVYSIAGVTTDDFLFSSVLGGGNGTWYTAAHVQGIGPNGEDSGWIGYKPPVIPEPGTVVLLGTGLTGFGLYGRRRMRKQ